MNELYYKLDNESFNQEVGLLLLENIKKYTAGESATLTVERSEELLRAILYTLNVYFDHYGVAMLSEGHLLSEIYTRSKVHMKSYIEEVQALYFKIEAKRMPVNNQLYRETFEMALPEFFKKYNPEFDAQNTVTAIDYPLLFDPMQSSGIVYIHEYLEKFEVENEFCCFFYVLDINKLINRFYSKYQCTAFDGYFNLFELVFRNYFISCLSGGAVPDLLVTPDQCVEIEEKLLNLDVKAYIDLSQKLVSGMIEVLGIKNCRLIKLLYDYTDDMLPGLMNAVENRHLNNFIL
ncbi:MAG: hypothetical protein JXO44_02080 [Clostridia bacterium]|nr:hypothetical protein [Clostridia bacterium]